MAHTTRLILQRFEELQAKAARVRETYHEPFLSQGKSIYYVDAVAYNEWAVGVMSLLQRVFGKDSVHYTIFDEHYDNLKHYSFSSDFESCCGILRAAQEDYTGGYLFNVRSLIKAETTEDILAQAVTLKDSNQPDMACILAGIALEMAVKERCEQEQCAIGSFNAMNQTLKDIGLYNQAMWEQLKSWYTRRSKAAHGELGQSTCQDVDEMIKGIRRFIAEYL